MIWACRGDFNRVGGLGPRDCEHTPLIAATSRRIKYELYFLESDLLDLSAPVTSRVAVG